MPALIALLPSLLAALPSLWTMIQSIRGAAQQSGEWTPELETQYQNALMATKTDPAWQSDRK
jgi:hypothetical protein